MTVTTEAPIAKTTAGTIRGRWEGEVAAFLGIPYAQPPVGELRWAPPVGVSGWDGIHPADREAAVPPQHASRLEMVMGPMRAAEASEDCLTVNVWTPHPSTGERLPVLVFFHGGGYLSGAGSAAWYEGLVMAKRGPAVVVTINYRLGALGYLYLPPAITGGDPVANLGLLDMCLALEWVRANASAFGGDPSNITAFGQSGGAHSIVALQGVARAAGLFERAILQSPPLFLSPASPEEAERNTRIFLEVAGVPDVGIADLRSLAVPDIIAAQRATLGRTAAFMQTTPPFHLVLDGKVLSEDPFSAQGGLLDDVDLMVGFTADESRAFLAFDDALWSLPTEALVERVREQRGEEAARLLQAYADRSSSEPGAAAVCNMMGDSHIVGPTIRLAEGGAAAGKPVYLFRFSWRSDAAGRRVGACHTIELPFVFNNFERWAEAPMLGDYEPHEVEGLASAVQDAWLAFAATGNPGHSGLPPWGPYGGPDETVMDFGVPIRILADPTDGRRELWPADRQD